MKKIIVFLMLVLFTNCATVVHEPFAGRTRTRPINKMSRTQVKNVQYGDNLYIHRNGDIYVMRKRNVLKIACP